MRALSVRAALLAVLLPAGGAAQTLPLTESEALSRLSAESPRVQAIRAAVDVARADALSASRWPNPRVGFNREAVSGVTEHMVTVSQVLPVTGRRGLEVRAASARVDAAAARAGDETRRLRADLRLAFTDLWSAQRRERELTGAVGRLRDLAAALVRREAAGESAGFDRLRAEGELLDVEADRLLAAADRMRAAAVLSGFFAGGADSARIEAAAVTLAPAPVPPLAELVARAEAQRGDLAALQREIEAAGFTEQAARRRRVPEPEIVAGSKSSDAGPGDTGSIVSVQLGLPLFDRAAPERAAARARAAQLRADLASRTRVLHAQVAAWHAAVVERRAAAASYGAAVGSVADQVERIAQVSYDAGERGILELLDAYRTAAQARLRLVELEALAREAEIELEFASGWEMP